MAGYCVAALGWAGFATAWRGVIRQGLQRGKKGSSMADSILYRGGLPYEPDVKRLNEHFPPEALTEGKLIGHPDLEPLVQAQRKTTRYYCVVTSWIKHQRNHNGIILRWERGAGIRVLAPSEVLTYAEKTTSQKLHQTARAVKMFGWVDRDRLNETGQARLDHQLRAAAVIKSAIDQSRKDLAIELAPVKSLPKRIAK